MKARYSLSILLVLLVGVSHSSMAACDQTLSVGANVASAVANAASGTTICLNNGNYGKVDFFNISRSNLLKVFKRIGILIRYEMDVCRNAHRIRD